MAPAVAQSQSYIPPKWGDITPLLYYSARLWGLFFLLALFREFLDRSLRPSRPIPRIRDDSSYRRQVMATLSYYYKRARLVIMRWQISESDFISNVLLPRCIVGAFISAFYIINTHTKNITPFFYFIQVLYGVVAFLCLVFDFVYTPNPIYFLFRPGIIVECLTIPSLLLASNSLWLNLNFLQAYSILTLWYNLAQHEIVLKNATQLNRLYTSMSLELATFVYVTACGVHFFELLGDPGQAIRNNTFYITWANSLYFAVVTLMTVGYGDFAPYTFFGRVWIVVHIIRAAYLVVREMDFLYTTEANQRHGITSYVETLEYNHIVLTGYIKWEFLKNFVVEFLKDGTNDHTKVVVLTSSRTWAIDEWDKFISRNVFYDYRVFHVEGSPLDHFDLERARIVSARAVFVFSDPHRGDPYDEDSGCLKTILSIRKYGGNVPIFTFNISQNSSAQFAIAMEQIDTDWFDDSLAPFAAAGDGPDDINGGGILAGIMPDPVNAGMNPIANANVNSGSSAANENTPLITRDTTAQLLDFNNSHLWQDESLDPHIIPSKKRPGESLCTQEFEMALLAENVFCNGLSTLLANLVLHFAPVPKPKDRLWLLEYKLGAQCSIVPLVVPENFHGKTYESVATILMDYGIVLLAVQDNTVDGSAGENGKWNIITVDTVLKKEQRCMVITYHAIQSVPWIMERLLDNYNAAQENEQRGQMGTIDIEDVAPEPIARSFTPVGVAPRNRIFTPDRRNPLPDRHELIRSHSQLPTTSFADNTFLGSASTRNVPLQSQDLRSGAPAGLGMAAENANVANRNEYRDLFSDDDRDNDERRRDSFDGLEDAVVVSDYVSPPNNNNSNNSNSNTGFMHGGLPMAFDGQAETERRSSFDEQRTQSSTSRSGSSSREAPKPSGSGSGSGFSHHGRRRISVHPSFSNNVNWERSSQGTPSSVPTTRIYSNLVAIPTNLSNHVIICLDGEHSLKSLKVLLENIWKKRKSQRRRTKVVVIHPNFPKNFEREIANAGGYNYNGMDLFLLKGHSLSTLTLKAAQYERSRGLLILNRENCGTDSTKNTDSKAIFTVMTLDSMPDRKNVFVCCMLDAEESLRLMRAPRHHRSIAFSRDDDGAVWDSSDDERTNNNNNGNNGGNNNNGNGKPIPRSTSGTFQYGSMGAMSAAESFERNSSFQSRGSNLAGMLFEEDFNTDDYREDSNTTSQDGTPRYRAEGELCERQRYASGEMIISTLYAALLVREEGQPGFIEVMRSLLGIRSKDEKGGDKRGERSAGRSWGGSWVRLVRIPSKWTQSALPECRNYRETSQQLFKLGVVTVGLYRSGRAAVRYMKNEKEGTFERRQEGVSYNEACMGSGNGNGNNNSNGSIGTRISTLLPSSLTAATESARLLNRNNGNGNGNGNRRRSRSRSPARSRGGECDNVHGKNKMLFYTCPSTGRVIEYSEHECDNVLPYVYCFPEPYTVVDGGDGVFVVCDPDKHLPSDWDLPEVETDVDVDLDMDMDMDIHGDFVGSHHANSGGLY